jgi:hypothetical protein
MFFASFFSIFFFFLGGLAIFLALFFQGKKKKKKRKNCSLQLKASILLSNCHFLPQTYEKQECSSQASCIGEDVGLQLLLGEET